MLRCVRDLFPCESVMSLLTGSAYVSTVDRYLMPYLLEDINTQSKKLFRQFTCLLYVRIPRKIEGWLQFFFLIQMSQEH